MAAGISIQFNNSLFSGNLGASDNAASNVVMDAAAQSVEIFLPVYEKEYQAFGIKWSHELLKSINVDFS